MAYIISQVLVGIADIFFVLSMLSKSKLRLTLLLLCSDVLFATHYHLLGAYTGTIILFIDAIFLVVAFILQQYKKNEYFPLASSIAISAVLLAGYFTWAGPISLLPMFAIWVYIFAMIFKNLIVVKVGTCIRNILNIAYCFLISSYIGGALECALLINSIVGTIITIKQYKKHKRELAR